MRFDLMIRGNSSPYLTDSSELGRIEGFMPYKFLTVAQK